MDPNSFNTNGYKLYTTRAPVGSTFEVKNQSDGTPSAFYGGSVLRVLTPTGSQNIDPALAQQLVSSGVQVQSAAVPEGSNPNLSSQDYANQQGLGGIYNSRSGLFNQAQFDTELKNIAVTKAGEDLNKQSAGVQMGTGPIPGTTPAPIATVAATTAPSTASDPATQQALWEKLHPGTPFPGVAQPTPAPATAAAPVAGLTKVLTGSVGPDGKPIYDVFSGTEHIADPNDPRLKGVDINTLADSQAPPGFKSKFEQAHAIAQGAGAPTPTTAGAGLATVDQYTPKTQQPNTQADTVVAASAAHQKYLDDFAASQSSANQQQTLVQQYQTMSQQLGIPALNTQLLNMKTIMDGSEQDIRNEVQAAGGMATDSQVLALTNARNKSMIQNYNNLLQTRDDMQQNLTTMMGLAQQDKAYASQQIDRQLNFDQQQMQYADKMVSAAQDSLTNSAKTMGWDGVLSAALASGDPQTIQKINSVMGPGFDLATAAKQEATATATANAKASADIKYTQAQTAKIYNDIKAISDTSPKITIPVQSDNGSTSYVPMDLAPYYNVSNSGVEYIDASTLQGTAAQKAKLVNEASQAGYKVITNKNTAADLVNIKDANSKLDSISTVMAGIGQPGFINRLAGGLGITWLETATQSDPQKAAAGALQAVGLDILKAISGVQGFRGNQSAIQQVTDHLPKVTDTVDVINQKVAYIRQLISDREDAAVGKPTVQVVPADQVPAGYYQANDGLFYKK